MADNSDPVQTRLPRKLSRYGLLLVGLALALFVLAIAGQIIPWAAVAVFVVVAVIVLLLPNTDGADDYATAATGEGSHRGEPLMRALVDALPDPAIVLNARAQVVHANPAAAAQFPNVSAGNPLAFALRQPALLSAVECAAIGGIAQTIDLHQTVPNETWHRVTAAPIAGADGLASGYLLVTLHPQTEQKRVEALRADFVANVSHELRTPLTSLIGFLDTLLGPAAKDAEARTKFLTIMRGQAERMSKLIDDLLSLSRIEMRQHLRPTGSVDLVVLLREVVELLQPQAADASVTINMVLPDGPTMVTGEREELFEVFENILDNAIKYGGSGGAVDVALTKAERPGLAQLVTITDNGPGVPEEHVPRLTERFYRVDAESSRRKKGTGLGLAIVKHIVNRHRGELIIRSRPGQGTRVEVALPA